MLLNIIFSNPLLGALLFIAMAISLTMHEFGHAYVALLNGDRTAKMNGRVSFNPLRHLDPLGTIMLLTVGFGFAKPVPVNPNNFRKYKKGMFTTAIAGVSINLTLAIISSFIYVLMMSFGIFPSFIEISPRLLSAFFMLFGQLNLALCFFNLLPLFPLDGFRVLETFAPRSRVSSFLRKYGFIIFLVLIAANIIVNIGLDRGMPSWFRFFDILGTYMRITADALMTLLCRLWAVIFNVPTSLFPFRI